MKGIEIIKDSHGRMREIKVDVLKCPTLAEDIYRMIAIAEREEQALAQRKARISREGDQAMSMSEFKSLIRESKKSGEITEGEFLKRHPEWQRIAKSS